MSIEWQQQSKNVFPSLGYNYAPILLGEPERSPLWHKTYHDSMKRISQENARALEGYEKSLHRVSDVFDPAMYNYMVTLNKLALPGIKTQIRNHITSVLNTAAERLGSQLAMSPDDVKQTVEGPDSLYKIGSAASQAGSLLGFSAALL